MKFTLGFFVILLIFNRCSATPIVLGYRRTPVADCNISSETHRPQFCDADVKLYRNCPSEARLCNDIGSKTTINNCRECCSNSTPKTFLWSSPVDNVKVPTKQSKPIKPIIVNVTRRHTDLSKSQDLTTTEGNPNTNDPSPAWVYVLISLGAVIAVVLFGTAWAYMYIYYPVRRNELQPYTRAPVHGAQSDEMSASSSSGQEDLTPGQNAEDDQHSTISGMTSTQF